MHICVDRKIDDRRFWIIHIMDRIKIVVLISVLIIIQCFAIKSQETRRGLEDFGRKLEKYQQTNKINEVSLSVLKRVFYGRSILVGNNCPYGTIRMGNDCVPRPDSDYEYYETHF